MISLLRRACLYKGALFICRKRLSFALLRRSFVDLQQFVDIVEAEEVRAHSQFSKNLRTMAKGTSKWWSDIPSSIDQFL